MNRIVTYVKTVCAWLAKPKLAWFGLGITVLFIYLAFRRDATEPQIRVAGLGLQWLGIGTVAYGVRKTRQLFGEPSFLDRFRAWLSDRPKWRRDIVMMAGTGALKMTGGTAHLEVWSTMDPNSPIDQQVTALVNNVQRLREGQKSLRKKIDAATSSHAKALADEQHLRAAADAKLDARLREAQTGGLHITFLGALWLFLGVLFSSVPGEIHSWRH